MLQSKEDLNKLKENIDKVIEKIESGELKEQEELMLLKEINFSYDVFNKFLEGLKVEKLSSDLKK